ncbi:MAG: DUF2892 domain-containing protein [Bacteroidales bacterium]|nr:DUF2892 domain-containing protein [Bacteroidales bacterium]
MKKNLGGTDKIMRLVIAVVIVILFFTEIIYGIFGIVMLVIAGILLLTSLVNFCPLYSLLGINTCPVKEKKEE